MKLQRYTSAAGQSWRVLQEAMVLHEIPISAAARQLANVSVRVSVSWGK